MWIMSINCFTCDWSTHARKVGEFRCVQQQRKGFWGTLDNIVPSCPKYSTKKHDKLVKQHDKEVAKWK